MISAVTSLLLQYFFFIISLKLIICAYFCHPCVHLNAADVRPISFLSHYVVVWHTFVFFTFIYYLSLYSSIFRLSNFTSRCLASLPIIMLQEDTHSFLQQCDFSFCLFLSTISSFFPWPSVFIITSTHFGLQYCKCQFTVFNPSFMELEYLYLLFHASTLTFFVLVLSTCSHSSFISLSITEPQADASRFILVNVLLVSPTYYFSLVSLIFLYYFSLFDKFLSLNILRHFILPDVSTSVCKGCPPQYCKC